MTGVQTCALPILGGLGRHPASRNRHALRRAFLRRVPMRERTPGDENILVRSGAVAERAQIAIGCNPCHMQGAQGSIHRKSVQWLALVDIQTQRRFVDRAMGINVETPHEDAAG